MPVCSEFSYLCGLEYGIEQLSAEGNAALELITEVLEPSLGLEVFLGQVTFPFPICHLE